MRNWRIALLLIILLAVAAPYVYKDYIEPYQMQQEIAQEQVNIVSSQVVWTWENIWEDTWQEVASEELWLSLRIHSLWWTWEYVAGSGTWRASDRLVFYTDDIVECPYPDCGVTSMEISVHEWFDFFNEMMEYEHTKVLKEITFWSYVTTHYFMPGMCHSEWYLIQVWDGIVHILLGSCSSDLDFTQYIDFATLTMIE